MMSRKTQIIFFRFWMMAVLMLLASCLPSSGSGGRKSKKASSVATSSGTAVDYSDTTDDDTVYWYSQGNYISGTLTVDSNIDTVVFLRGTGIHDYLKTDSNFSKTYCTLITYNSSNITNKEQLRVRAVPVSTTNISTGVQEYTLRLDLHESTTNQGACAGSLTSELNSAVTIAAASAAYAPDEICTGCTGRLNSASVLLFTTSSNTMSDSTEIPEATLNLSTLGLTLDMSNSSGSGSSNSTSDSECIALGYDCALNGQCVNDGALRPGATSNASYTEAQLDVATNPTHFILYPEIYYVCGQAPSATPASTGAANVSATASAMLTQAINQYQCFYDSTTTTYCSIADYSINYSDTQDNVRIQCGCDADPDASYPDDPVTACPGYGLKAVLRDGTYISGTILTTEQKAETVRVDCIVPDSGADPTPFQELQLTVNNRNAPHRMFLTDGTPVSDITDYYETPVSAEGTPFSYLDEAGKTLPDSGSFNMNHIIGQFNVSLTEALPAVEVNVEYDQSYTISAIEGYSTPCRSCARDSWFSAFTAYPESQYGNGVSSISYSTERDNWGDNLTYGNYEDTIFGRACWLPPTMVPWSHNPNADVKTQRLNRLATQAAFWSNGYQRDWWGFNKNALIGSWDGVRWFAIGKGRRVKAKTTKLYLAMNSPYADLAEATDVTVQIVADSSLNSASEYDYDPDLTYNHPSQNSAGSCQMHHMCETDSDCITKLGWEYVCADVSKFKTRWPEFDSSANEKANSSKTYTIATMLEQGVITGGTNYRCVYRGAGAPCRIKYWEDSSGNNFTSDRDIKQWACAPNFHCSALTSNDYNRAVARERDNLGVILFGQESDVLGRPENYIQASYSLTSSIRTNVAANATAAAFGNASTTAGICRPGKNISTADQREAHQSEDPNTNDRVDYISQIAPCEPDIASCASRISAGACDDLKKSFSRIASCPVLDAEGNYYYNSTNYEDLAGSDPGAAYVDADFLYLSRAQNACGKESQNATGVSAFQYIEAAPIGTAMSSGIFEPTLAANACLRRAGAVCHTDLDCTPNKLHADQAGIFDISYFGNTTEEKEYWEQYLVCGQAKSKPMIGDDDYFDYDMSLNRCCREVGKNLTMYTQDATDVTGTLDVELFPAQDPVGDGRYSRYQTMYQSFAYPSPAPVVASDSSADFNYPRVNFSANPTYALLKQWKTIQETGKRTCCGGGFIRKFADGGNDWSKTDRVKYSVSDFQCLNYSNTVALERPLNFPSTAYSNSRDWLCADPLNGGCIQSSMSNTSSVPESPTTLGNSADTVSNFINTDGLFTGIDIFSPHSIKPVTAAYDHIDFSYIDDPNYGGNGDGDITENTGPGIGDTYSVMEFWIPSYIYGCTNLQNGGGVTQVWRYESDLTVVAGGDLSQESADYSSPAVALVPSVANQYTVGCWDTAPMGANCTFPTGVENHVVFCFDFESTGKLYVKYYNTSFTTGRKIFWTLNFWRPGTSNWNYDFNNPGNTLDNVAGATSPAIGKYPGNASYYLLKFGKFELKGIPQITYEPLYCNSDVNTLVPNLYSLTGAAENRFTFDNASNAVDAPSPFYPFLSVTGDVTNPDEKVVYQDKIATDTVFSENDFMCCLNLGEETSDYSKCCSGYGVDDDGDSKYTCKLPAYADLSVYFNAFVSSDGRGEDAPGGGLTDDDFHPLTGEPNIIKFNDDNSDGDYDSVSETSDTWEKLIDLGEAYCESGAVISGGAFGDFQGEPFPSFGQTDQRVYSIIDSALDYSPATGSEEERGYVKFMSGARWNHHIYCAP